MKKKRQLIHSPLEKIILKGADEGGSVSIPSGVNGLILNLAFGIYCLFVVVCLSQVIFLSPVFAQGKDSNSTVLAGKILEAKSSIQIYSLFEEATDHYFKENKYNEYVEYLKSLSQKKSDLEPIVNYYIALTRYYQLKYLEESQNWSEYFDNSNNFRGQVIEFAQKAIDKTIVKEPINIYAKLVLWRLHKGQEDNLAESALSDLMNGVLEYSKEPLDITLIKDVADQLRLYEEKLKSRELYKIYVDKIAASDTNFETLKSIASDFYKEGNLELSELIYDVYIDKGAKILTKNNLIPVLISIAQQFSCQSPGGKDLFYAEKVFKKMEDIGGKSVFDEGLSYLRAFNLEKAKEYVLALDIYMDLAARYPKSPHLEEADYKIGIIFTYVLRNIKMGREYFEKLANMADSDEPPVSLKDKVNLGEAAQTDEKIIRPETVSSLYQLGLLSQWDNDFVKAKQYYDLLIEIAKDSFVDKVKLTKERLKELGQEKPIENKLKMFLDVSLKSENAMFDMAKIDLKSAPYYAKKNENVSVSSTVYTPESGCMQVKLDYFWSGDLGSAKPSLNEASFDTAYTEPGTKEINLVVVSSTGIFDRSIDIVNVY